MRACTSLWRRDRDAKGAGVEGKGMWKVFPFLADYRIWCSVVSYLLNH